MPFLKSQILIVALGLLWSLSNLPASASEDEEDYNGILFNAPGADTTYAYCAGCHSERIVAQQGMTREGWVDLLEWMVEEQGMGEIDEPDYSEVIDYLAQHYGEDRPNFPTQ